MKQYSFEKLLDESLIKEQGKEARDRVLLSSGARNLKQLYRTRRIGASVEENSQIRESASKLFGTLAQLTTCGPKIRALEAVIVEEHAGETEIDKAYQSHQEQNVETEQEDRNLIVKAERLFRQQVSAADPNQKEVRYILPYPHTGVWHCLFRSSEFVCVISVTESRKIKVVGRLWYD